MGVQRQRAGIQIFQNQSNNGAILVSTSGSGSGAPQTLLWSEPQAELVAEGNYDIAKGLLSVTKAQVMTEWLLMVGRHPFFKQTTKRN